MIFAYVIAPLVGVLQRHLRVRGQRELSRGFAIAIAYAIMFGGLALLVAWMTPRLTEAAMQLPQRLQVSQSSGGTIGSLARWLRPFGVSSQTIGRVAAAGAGEIQAAVGAVATASVHVAAYLPWLVLIPIIAVFLLKDATTLTGGAIEMLPSHWRSHASPLLERLDTALAAYVRAQLVAAVIVGAVVGTGFATLSVPFSAVLGVAAGAAEFVPILGPLAVAVVSALVVALDAPMKALWVLLFLAVVRVIEDYVIYPRLIGSRVDLPPLAVILAVLAGGELAGVVGVLLSVPLLAIASAVGRYLNERRHLYRHSD